GPDVVGYHPRVGAEHRRDRPGRGQRAHGVEPSGYPLPFLQVAEERPGRGEVARLAVRCDGLTCPFLVTCDSLDVVPDTELVDRGDPGRAGLAGPLGRLRDLRMFGGEPPTDLRQQGTVVVSDLARQRAGGVPAFDPFGPRMRGPLDLGH